MLFAIMTLYAAYRGIWWIVDWQQGKFTATTFSWAVNCVMACVATICVVAIIFSTSINMTAGESGFGINIVFAYELKAKE
jgi:predicted transporter